MKQLKAKLRVDDYAADLRQMCAMPIPLFNDRGFLPPGVHACTIDEIRDRFGRFDRSDKRPKLWEKLDAFVNEARRTRIPAAIVINGSFTTAKPEPGDIDVVLVLQRGHDFASDVGPDDYNLLSKRSVARRFGFDMFVAEDGSAEYNEYTGFYQQVKDQPGEMKGVLRLAL